MKRFLLYTMFLSFAAFAPTAEASGPARESERIRRPLIIVRPVARPQVIIIGR